jgi:hypothetical protein
MAIGLQVNTDHRVVTETGEQESIGNPTETTTMEIETGRERSMLTMMIPKLMQQEIILRDNSFHMMTSFDSN